MIASSHPGGRGRRAPRCLIPYDEVSIDTEDGWRLTLFHSPPPTGGDVLGRPVLMIPGMSANRYSFGLRPGTSLPGALNAAGRDVWLLELRGSASSRRLVAGAPVDIDRKLRRDVPRAMTEVLRRTGADVVDLVGHSLGGLLAHLTQGGPRGAQVGRVTSLCAPYDFASLVLGRRRRGLSLPLRAAARALGRVQGFGLPALARTRGPLPHVAAFRRHFRLGVLDLATTRAWLDHAVEDLPGGDLAQILRWAASGALTDRFGADYGEILARAHQPTLVIASAADKIVPVASVRSGFEALGSRAAIDKRFTVVGRAQGHRTDYGHAGLLVAPSARADVFEPIVRWLAGGASLAEAPVPVPASTAALAPAAAAG